MTMKKVNLLKTLRIDAELSNRLAILVKKSKFSESDILRAALNSGFDQIESGKFNPFTGTSTIAEEPPTYQVVPPKKSAKQ